MSSDFVAIMATLDPAMIIVTTAAGDERGGCLVGFHAQSSIDPERYCVWLSKANYTYRLALRATHLGIHFLAGSDHDLAARFGGETGDDMDKFDGIEIRTGPGAVPMIEQCPNRLVVAKIALLDEGGDHVCITTEPVRVQAGPVAAPLRLSEVSDVTPGHDNDERNSPHTERAR